jgi:2-dehydro-3-deoxy-D-gluconate 5-dehydrogenase
VRCAEKINMPGLDLFSLQGKTALVTGARRGIGKAIAVGLAEAGADIIGVSAGQEPADSQVESEVRQCGHNFHGYRCDFSDRQALYGFIHQVQQDFPTIDILVNNAGNVYRQPAHEYPDEAWDRLLEINLSAQFILSRELGKGMLQRGNGKIIFTVSLLAFQGGILVPAYSASKGGVAQLVKALSNEWASKGIQVNGIAPGYINTDNTQALRGDPVRSRAILERIPAGRWGEPEDFKGPAIFLASAASNYVSGEILTVDGGWMGR